MLKNTVFSSGKNNFKDYVFSASEWSAPTMVSPDEIRHEIDKLNLIGRRIKDMRMIGLSYYLRRNWIEDSAYRSLPKNMSEEEKQHKSNYENISSSLLLSRYSHIDEPLLIKFDDDDIFEIDTPQVPEFRFSMNCIPWFIDFGTNTPNVDANVLFAPCIGKKIEHVSVETYVSDKDPMFNRLIDEDGKKHEIVSRIVLWLEGNVGLSIRGYLDYCEISCIDKDNSILPITFGELKPGLFNWEDIHTDNTVNFEANSCTLHFGKIGAAHTATPYMTIVPADTQTKMHISVDDFVLLEWSMTNILREQFDEYGDYDLSFTTWNDILTEAQKITDFELFDDLFDYMSSKTEYGLMYMNHNGAHFWRNKNRYLSQLKDIKEWSELTMIHKGNISIYGF